MEVTHIFSKKQLKLLKLFKNGGLKRINILEGSVRSGKTYISLIIWALFVACGEKNASYLMCAKTLTGLRRNVLDTLENLVGSANFSYSVSKKEGTLFGRKVYLEGASDSRAEGKIRGLTLSGAYCDEITLFSEDFFAMLLSIIDCASLPKISIALSKLILFSRKSALFCLTDILNSF